MRVDRLVTFDTVRVVNGMHGTGEREKILCDRSVPLPLPCLPSGIILPPSIHPSLSPLPEGKRMVASSYRGENCTWKWGMSGFNHNSTLPPPYPSLADIPIVCGALYRWRTTGGNYCNRKERGWLKYWANWWIIEQINHHSELDGMSFRQSLKWLGLDPKQSLAVRKWKIIINYNERRN